MYIFWLIVAVIFFFIEISTIGFFTLWFGIGALAAMVVSFFVDNLVAQTSVFIVVSTILLVLTKTLLKKFFKIDDDKTPDQFSVVGKKGLVTLDIDPASGKGQVKVESSIWSAKSANSVAIPKGTEIIVEKIEGVKVVVKPTKVTSTSN